MRAVLILTVLMAWVACLLGAIVLPAYLAITAIRGRRRGERRDPPPPLVVVVAVALFASVMAACAVVLTVWEFQADAPDPWSRALAWAGLPSWTALCAATTAIMLWRRRRTASTVPLSVV